MQETRSGSVSAGSGTNSASTVSMCDSKNLIMFEMYGWLTP